MALSVARCVSKKVQSITCVCNSGNDDGGGGGDEPEKDTLNNDDFRRDHDAEDSTEYDKMKRQK